ncbi:MAG: 1,4-alpha-glucan branching enzyme, partial [Methylococcaceae bacterium]|nr:1,4-alpha-glucan branching enzyme [Methylococcaceae bacterium]
MEEETASSTLDSNPKTSVKPKTEAKAEASDARKPEKAKTEVKVPASEPAKTIAAKKEENKLDPDSIKIIEAKHHDPFSVLGRHPKNNQILIKAYLPYAETVRLSNNGPVLNRITGTDFFEYYAKEGELPEHYKL